MGFVQGRGGSQGYDAALALQTKADVDELEKENIKSFAPLEGEIAFSVVKVRNCLSCSSRMLRNCVE